MLNYRSKLYLAALGLFFASAYAQDQPGPFVPYDPTVTLVVDKQMQSSGAFTTINAALDQIRQNGDASSDKTYRILITAAPTAYDEIVNLTGIKHTSISSLGGRARVAEFVGCDVLGQPCQNITLSDMSTESISLGKLTAPNQDRAFYSDLVIENMLMDGGETGAAQIHLAKCENSVGFNCSATIRNNLLVSETHMSLIWIQGQGGAGVNRLHIVGNTLRSARCGGGISLEKLGDASSTSSALIVGNQIFQDDLLGTGGCPFVYVKTGSGNAWISGNQFTIQLSAPCIAFGPCWYAGIEAHQDIGAANELLFAVGNSFHVIADSTGHATSQFDFVRIGRFGAANPVINGQWYVSENDFRVTVKSGDFNLSNVRDIKLGPEAMNYTVFVRNQELRYGVEVDPASTSKVVGWPMVPVVPDPLTARGGLRMQQGLDGLFYYDSAEHQVAARDIDNQFTTSQSIQGSLGITGTIDGVDVGAHRHSGAAGDGQPVTNIQAADPVLAGRGQVKVSGTSSGLYYFDSAEHRIAALDGNTPFTTAQQVQVGSGAIGLNLVGSGSGGNNAPKLRFSAPGTGNDFSLFGTNTGQLFLLDDITQNRFTFQVNSATAGQRHLTIEDGDLILTKAGARVDGVDVGAHTHNGTQQGAPVQLMGQDLTAGSCTANEIRLDTGSATRKICVCDTNGTAWRCAELTATP